MFFSSPTSSGRLTRSRLLSSQIFLCEKSFYGKAPPQLFFNEIVGFETSSRRCLHKSGAPCHPNVIEFDSPTILMRKQENSYKVFSFQASFLVSSSHDMLVKEHIAGSFGESIAESV